MSTTINTYHGTYNRTARGGLSNIRYFVIHYTAGTGSAKNNCIYFASANRNASADFFIDPNGAIWEYNNILDGYYTWAVGDGGGKFGITNRNSVNVEVVNNGGAFTEAQINALRELYTHVCNILGRKLEVVRHYDASRKHCPVYYVDSGRWANLKPRVNLQPGWVKDSKGWWWMNSDGTYPKSEWLKDNGKWYWFDARGYAVSSCWKKIGGYWYWFNSWCAMVTGWKKIGGLWYYLNPKKNGKFWEGAAHIGWLKLADGTYYLKNKSEGIECSMACNETMTIDGKQYRFDSSGRLVQ